MLRTMNDGKLIEVGRGVSVEYARRICQLAAQNGIRASFSFVSEITVSLWVTVRHQDAFYRLRVREWL